MPFHSSPSYQFGDLEVIVIIEIPKQWFSHRLLLLYPVKSFIDVKPSRAVDKRRLQYG